MLADLPLLCLTRVCRCSLLLLLLSAASVAAAVRPSLAPCELMLIRVSRQQASIVATEGDCIESSGAFGIAQRGSSEQQAAAAIDGQTQQAAVQVKCKCHACTHAAGRRDECASTHTKRDDVDANDAASHQSPFIGPAASDAPLSALLPICNMLIRRILASRVQNGIRKSSTAVCDRVRARTSCFFCFSFEFLCHARKVFCLLPQMRCFRLLSCSPSHHAPPLADDSAP